ncbi:MAG TPA: HAD-IC family P-type ATPase, partial [Candidatus Polarisedimenticolia bacterium]|nr:HAD-IC family P-type ATPase [Candidatus Polarisedimenticolia bacterium]
MGLVGRALRDAGLRMAPWHLVRSPVMFVVWVGALFVSGLGVRALSGAGEEKPAFVLAVAACLWGTVLLANFAEAMAQGRGRAYAASLRRVRRETQAKRLCGPERAKGGRSGRDASHESIPASQVRRGDRVLVEEGDIIPCDGEVVEGIASVDESAITGESAPVIRESGGDRSAVTAGTRVLSDWLIVRATAEPGHSFLDRMIQLVEGARRRKTPNEIALDTLLAFLSLVFLLATSALQPLSLYSAAAAGRGAPVSFTLLVALLVCLIPTTIGGLMAAIGIAGMDRLIRANVVATSGRAVEAAGDVGVLLLDKTGTITLGNRQAAAFLPAVGVEERELADAAQLASLSDETPEGRSIVVLAKQRFGLRGRDLEALGATFVPFSAHTRMSGVDVAG